jgi:hypothetical protein
MAAFFCWGFSAAGVVLCLYCNVNLSLNESRGLICCYIPADNFFILQKQGMHRYYPVPIKCSIDPTNQVEKARQLIVGKWNWLEEGPNLISEPAKTPCSEKLHKVAEFTADGKVYIYYNFHLAEKYSYRIIRANQYIFPMPQDTFGILHLRDYVTGKDIQYPQVETVIFLGVCDKTLYLNYVALYHTRGNEIWSRFE